MSSGRSFTIKRALKKGIFIFSVALLLAGPPTAAFGASSAVVIMYHRFGEGEYPSTNTTIGQLDAHIKELTSGPYTVLPVPKIVESLIKGEALPNRTVGITIDDAYRSVYEVAWPKFKAAGLPITIFVSTANLDGGSGRHMSWEQLREMVERGASVGHHTVSHLHMVNSSPGSIGKELTAAHVRFDKELGFRPRLFSYPYGETSLSIIKYIKNAGFEAAFGQHSGVIGSAEDYFYLPRFSMNERYGGLDRLRLAINALPLPLVDVTPRDPLIGTKRNVTNPPPMGFTIAGNLENLDKLACFLSHAGRAKIERFGSGRIEVRISQPFPKGRTRLNCTLPGPNNRWHWYGRQFYRP